jgi:hypothetical protein
LNRYAAFTNMDDYSFSWLKPIRIEDSHSVAELEVPWSIGGCVEVFSFGVSPVDRR